MVYFSISNEEWENLLNGQTSGKEIRILKDGALGLYEKPINILEGVNIQFNYDSEEWKETATLKEQVDYWCNEIKRLSREIVISNIDSMINSIPLQEKLERAKQEHTELSHELALQLNQ